jgi:hypothetical protein
MVAALLFMQRIVWWLLNATPFGGGSSYGKQSNIYFLA